MIDPKRQEAAEAKTQEALQAVYVAVVEELQQLGRDDTVVTLSTYSAPNTRGSTFYLLPMDNESCEEVGKPSTITALVDDELSELADEISEGDDSAAPRLAAFALELEQCAAKIRAFLAEQAPEEGE